LAELMQQCGIEGSAQLLTEAKKRTLSENRHRLLVSEAKRVRQDGEILIEYARQRMAELESLPTSGGKFDRRARDRLRKLETDWPPSIDTNPYLFSLDPRIAPPDFLPSDDDDSSDFLSLDRDRG